MFDVNNLTVEFVSINFTLLLSSDPLHCIFNVPVASFYSKSIPELVPDVTFVGFQSVERTPFVILNGRIAD